MTDIHEIPCIDRPMTKEEEQEHDEYGRWAEQRCREEMAKREEYWKQQRKTYAWFNKEPDWGGGSLCWFWIEDEPKEPCKVIYRFSLIGGGQLAVIEDFRVVTLIHNGVPTGETVISCTSMVHGRNLLVTPHTTDGVKRYRGVIDGQHETDISSDAVVFGSNVPQEIADRAAASSGGNLPRPP